MRIFIASSSKQILKDTDKGLNEDNINRESIPYKIYEQLKVEDHFVKPWWEEKTFKDGNNLFDSLLELTDTCNGAVFIFGKDDIQLESETYDKLFITRDNVLIEFGMFMSKLGKENTFVVFEDRAVKVPFDISGNQYAYFDNKPVDRVSDFFTKDPYKRKNDGSIVLFTNEALNTDILDQKYTEWSSKSMFIGTKSAKLWEKIETSTRYLIDYSRDALKSFFLELHEENNLIEMLYKVENVISLGPGCGYVDSEVINQIMRKDYRNLPNYIAIDINPHLAHMACKNIKEHITGIKAPFVIVDDFEKNAKQVGDIIFENITRKEEVSLFVMLGGTFNNLKSNELSFFNSIKYWLDDNDYFLLDVLIKQEDYKPTQDDNRDVKNLPDSYKDFMINSIEKSFKKFNVKRDNIDSFVTRNTVEKYSDSDCSIDKTCITTYNYNNRKLSEMLIVKRYNFNDFKVKLKKEFDVIYDLNGFDNLPQENETEPTSRGIFLLKKLKL